MTPDEMKRKGSWAVRFYGRKGKIPPLKDANGEPTRFALTARAWGEPVPRTVTEARAIATKGHALLAEYQKRKESGATTATKRGTAKRGSTTTTRATTAKRATAKAGSTAKRASTPKRTTAKRGATTTTKRAASSKRPAAR